MKPMNVFVKADELEGLLKRNGMGLVHNRFAFRATAKRTEKFSMRWSGGLEGGPEKTREYEAIIDDSEYPELQGLRVLGYYSSPYLTPIKVEFPNALLEGRVLQLLAEIGG